MLNMRDNLHSQIFQACLYRKLLVWNDLNIHPGEYCHQKVVDCIKMINEFQNKLNYKPTKLQFKELSLETPGYFSADKDSGSCESTETMTAMVDHFIDMEELIKKNFLMTQKSPEKIQEFNENNTVQRTLRDQLEIINQEHMELQEKYKQLVQQFYDKKGDNEQKN
jgi:hypothetical protein